MSQKIIEAPPTRQLSSISKLIGQIYIDCENAWRLPPLAITAIAFLPFLVALSGIVAFLLGKPVYVWYTREDGPVETMQVLIWVILLVTCILVVRQLWRTGNKGMALLYTCVCVGAIFVIGEEISWGQRIFSWQTPLALEEMNRQGETNLHNLFAFGDFFKWMQLLIGIYGTFLPFVVVLIKVPERYRKLTSMIVPHYLLVPYFFLLMSWRVIHNLTPLTQSLTFTSDKYTEIIELIMVLGLWLFMVYQTRQFSKPIST
jgi:hypothetical protein